MERRTDSSIVHDGNDLLMFRQLGSPGTNTDSSILEMRARPYGSGRGWVRLRGDAPRPPAPVPGGGTVLAPARRGAQAGRGAAGVSAGIDRLAKVAGVPAAEARRLAAWLAGKKLVTYSRGRVGLTDVGMSHRRKSSGSPLPPPPLRFAMAHLTAADFRRRVRACA